MSQKVKKEHFDKYQTEIDRFTKLFGLSDWDYRIAWVESDECGSYLSWTTFNTETRKATFYFPRVWPSDYEITDKEIVRSAFHEVCELLLCDLRYIAGERFIREEDEINKHIHILISRLQFFVENFEII